MSASGEDDRRFPPGEFAGRIARLRAAMRRHDVGVMLLDDSEILAYFTGYEVSLNRYRACIVPSEGMPMMVLRALDAALFRAHAWFPRCVGVPDTDDPVSALADALREAGHEAARIGVDFGSHALTVAGFAKLQAALPRAVFVAMTGVPWELRLEKSPAEVAKIARAARIADAAVQSIADTFQPGMTTRDATARAIQEFVAQGSDPHYVGRIAAGRGWDFLHAPVSDEALRPGDILHVELAPSYGGYSGRIMRSIMVGPVPASVTHTADVLVDLQDRQFAAMRPGALARDVDAILRDGVLRHGLRDSYPNITGYTLGYYSNQPLRSSDFTRTFHPGADWTLAADMVFHMYTSANGVAVSETILVTADGGRRLTSLPRGVLATR